MMRVALLSGATLLAYSLAISLAASTRAAPPNPALVNGVVEGCLNQLLFNGVWRLRITKVEQVHRRAAVLAEIPGSGWGVYVEWTNATTPGRRLNGFGNLTLIFSSGYGLGLNEYADSAELSGKGQYDSITTNEDQSGFSELFQNLYFPPGAMRKGELKFWYPASDPHFGGRPVKFVVEGTTDSPVHFVPLRVALNCTK
jgi:hypothetical protein